MIGAVVVGAVFIYNWVQERSLRRRLQQSFGEAHDDILLKAGLDSALADGRLEPQFAAGMPGHAPQVEPAMAQADEADAGFDDLLDYVAEISAETTIPEPLVGELVIRIASCGKPARARGLDPKTGEWEDIVRGAGGRHARLRAGLQIVNRTGAVSPAQLAAFVDAVRQCGEKVRAEVECPDPQAALKLARELDAFCATVDVAIGVNIVAPEGQAFAGTRIRAAAESVGFKLEPSGVFHFRGGGRQALFTLDNHEPAPFLPESIKGLSTSGITLLLDVPRVANGGEVLARMLNVAEHLASAIGGRLVDDNRATLSDAGVSRIREQLSSIQAAMTARGVPAGGTRALRLFS
jgi:hypothetical protein